MGRRTRSALSCSECVGGLSVKLRGASPGRLGWKVRSCPPKSCFSVADAAQVQAAKEGLPSWGVWE